MPLPDTITRADLISVLEAFDGGAAHRFADSTGYDVPAAGAVPPGIFLSGKILDTPRLSLPFAPLLAGGAIMRAAKQESVEPYVILCRWCTATNTWHDTEVRRGCVGDCETAATERGIYRVAVVCGGRRLHLEPFAVIASHSGDID